MTSYLSCDAARLYRDGGFPGEPGERDALIRSGPAAEFIAELHPPFTYTRPGGAVLEGETAGALAMMALVERDAVRGAACGLFRLGPARVRDGVVFIERDGGTHALYETHRPADRPTVTLAAPEALAAGPFETIEGPSLFLSSSGSFNYGHWIVDDLSRQAALHTMRARYPGRTITIVVDSFELILDEIRRQSLEIILGRDAGFEIRMFPWGRTVVCEDLHYASPTTLHPFAKSPEALRGLARLLRLRTRGDRFALARRRLSSAIEARRLPRLRPLVYLARRASRSRPLLNEGEVTALLLARGFERIDPEELSFAGQIARVADARIVVGAMGAAMTSSIACAPGTHVVHLAHEGWTDPFFWDLAAVMGHRFAAIYGRAEGPADTIYRPYTIDLDALGRRLDAITGRARVAGHMAVTPPSMTNSAPVTKDDSSAAR